MGVGMARPGGTRESEIRATLAKLRGGLGAIIALSAFINVLTITGSLLESVAAPWTQARVCSRSMTPDGTPSPPPPCARDPPSGRCPPS